MEDRQGECMRYTIVLYSSKSAMRGVNRYYAGKLTTLAPAAQHVQGLKKKCNRHDGFDAAISL